MRITSPQESNSSNEKTHKTERHINESCEIPNTEKTVEDDRVANGRRKSKKTDINGSAPQTEEKTKSAIYNKALIAKLGRKERKYRPRSEKHYAIGKATKEAATAFSNDIHYAQAPESDGIHSGIIGAFLAALRFIGKMIWILFRTIWRFLVAIAVIAICCVIVGALGVGYLMATSMDELPDLENYSLISMPQDSTIYDSDNNIIGVISSVSREPVSFSQISQPAKDAVVSIEDERFYNHEGIDFIGIARALKTDYESWRSGGSSTSQGASTITQQYVRNAYANVGNDQTISRKLTEMVLSAQLESQMSKDDILNSYLNTVYYGNGCYGIEAASQYYFGHSADSLDYYESALLASVLNSPSMYNLLTTDGQKATAERANLVLDKMYSLGKLGTTTEEQLHELKKTNVASKVHITEKERVINQPYYYDYVVNELSNDYTDAQIQAGGWQIYTTLSIADGKAATDVARGVEDEYGSGITCAIADVDVSTGAVRSFCGGTDYNASQYNIATQGHLQTGSSLKPIVYAALCEYDGYYITDKMDASPVNIGTADAPHIITPYVSGNSATIDQGIIASDNAMAIHAGKTVGMDKVAEMCSNVGMTTPLDQNVVATIGGQTTGFSPLEMATAYATVANSGQERDTWCIKSITDSYGNEVYAHDGSQSNYAMSPEVAHQITRGMQDAAEQASWYTIPFRSQGGWTIAAKTGTTDEETDIWCCGFDTTRSVSVWIGGRDARTPVTGGSSRSCLAFSDYMYSVAQSDPKQGFKQPVYQTQIPEKKDSQSLDEYEALLSSRQLTPSIKYVSDKDVPEGTVVGVEGENTLVARGSAVYIDIAREKITVPDFTKMSPSDVYSASNGLAVSFDMQYVANGSSSPKITAQSINAGSSADYGTSIVLTVEVLLPATENTTQQVPVRGSSSALELLTTQRDDLQTQTNRLQDYLDAANAKLNASSGQNTSQIAVPNVKGLTITLAKQVLTSCGFKISYSSSQMSDIVESQSPTGGSSAQQGATVILKSASTSENTNTNGNENSNSNTNANTNAG